MAYIQERTKNGKPSYTVSIRLKGHKPVFATFERKTDARNWITQTESSIREGRYFQKAEAQKHTVSDLVRRYTSDVLPHKPRSAKKYEYHLNWWEMQIGKYLLSDLSPALISEYRDKLLNEVTYRKTKRSGSSVNRFLASLSSACTTALKDWQWLEENPVLKVSKFPETRGRVRFLSDDERERLLVACRDAVNKELYFVTVLALSTGARRMELWSLKWGEVDLVKGFLFFTDTKNGDRRTVPIKGLGLELLKEKARLRRLDTDLLFPSKKNPRKPMDFRTPFECALKASVIQDFCWHDLRHSAASYLVMSGIDMRTVAEILGHKSLQMTQRYSHLSPDHLSNAVEKMNRRIFG